MKMQRSPNRDLIRVYLQSTRSFLCSARCTSSRVYMERDMGGDQQMHISAHENVRPLHASQARHEPLNHTRQPPERCTARQGTRSRRLGLQYHLRQALNLQAGQDKGGGPQRRVEIDGLTHVILIVGSRVQTAHSDRVIIAKGAVAVIHDEMPRSVVVGAQGRAADRVAAVGEDEVQTKGFEQSEGEEGGG